MHPLPPAVSRRNVIKTLGAGAALLSLGRVTGGSAAAAEPTVANNPPVGGTAQPFALPKLAYAYDALAPHFDARTMEIHYTKHHQTFVTTANKALEARPDLRELTAEQLLERLDAFAEPLRTILRNHVGGHLNHSFFWSVLATPAEYKTGPLRAEIDRRFGTFEAFQKEFTQAAMTRFGSGWAWLVWKNGELEVTSTANQDSPLMAGTPPIIGLDVWEHAYYLEYQNRRADYVSAFWKVLNWNAAEAAYAAAAA